MRLEIEILDFPIEGKCWGRGKRGGVGKKGDWTGLADWSDWTETRHRKRRRLCRRQVNSSDSGEVMNTRIIMKFKLRVEILLVHLLKWRAGKH
jgi:hypothetical protein